MNSRQQVMLRTELKNENRTINELKQVYEQAWKDCNDKIRELSMRTDVENIQSIVYQQKYQEAIKGQLEEIMTRLHTSEYETISDYLKDCYYDGFVGNMYDLAGQGIPLIVPINQNQVTKAIKVDSKLSRSLYESLGEDVGALKTAVRGQISRGIAAGMTWNEVASNLASNMRNTPFRKALSNATRITRTEGHRVQTAAKLDSMHAAKDRGANIVKQWDSTLDGKTRETHRELDGQIRELDEDFEIDGMSASAPGHFDDPAEDCNCRCAVLQSARWALDDGFTKMDNFSKTLKNFETPDDYEEFKKAYWSDENSAYMNNMSDMEEKYKTKNFEKLLEIMSDRDYKHYQELLDADPVYKSIDFGEQEILTQEGKISKRINIGEDEVNLKCIVDRELVNSKAFHDKFEKLGISKQTLEKAYKVSKKFLDAANGTEKEFAAVLAERTGDEVFNSLPLNNAQESKVAVTEEQYKEIISYKGNVILMHNHPESGRPSGTDILTAYKTPNDVGSLVVGHDGTLYYISDIKKDSGIDKIYKEYYDKHVRIALSIPDGEDLPEQIGKSVEKSCKIKATTDLYKANEDNKYFSIRRL